MISSKIASKTNNQSNLQEKSQSLSAKSSIGFNRSGSLHNTNTQKKSQLHDIINNLKGAKTASESKHNSRFCVIHYLNFSERYFADLKTSVEKQTLKDGVSLKTKQTTGQKPQQTSNVNTKRKPDDKSSNSAASSAKVQIKSSNLKEISLFPSSGI